MITLYLCYLILRLQSLYVLEGEGSEYCVADQETSHPHLQTCRLVNRRQYLNSNFDLRGILLNYYYYKVFLVIYDLNLI